MILNFLQIPDDFLQEFYPIPIVLLDLKLFEFFVKKIPN